MDFILPEYIKINNRKCLWSFKTIEIFKDIIDVCLKHPQFFLMLF